MVAIAMVSGARPQQELSEASKEGVLASRKKVVSLTKHVANFSKPNGTVAHGGKPSPVAALCACCTGICCVALLAFALLGALGGGIALLTLGGMSGNVGMIVGGALLLVALSGGGAVCRIAAGNIQR